MLWVLKANKQMIETRKAIKAHTHTRQRGKKLIKAKYTHLNNINLDIMELVL